MLPYDEGENEYSDDDRPSAFNYDDSIYSDLDTAREVYDFLQAEWQPNEGGFDASHIFDSIYEVDNFEVWFDDQGIEHGYFDYRWEDENGYSGVGHASW